MKYSYRLFFLLRIFLIISVMLLVSENAFSKGIGWIRRTLIPGPGEVLLGVLVTVLFAMEM